jgi:stage II sporulation protein Q
VKQGDKIGVSGENIYESDLKNHLHFIVEKDEKMINPEKYLDKEISSIK